MKAFIFKHLKILHRFSLNILSFDETAYNLFQKVQKHEINLKNTKLAFTRFCSFMTSVFYAYIKMVLDDFVFVIKGIRYLHFICS